MLLFNRNLFFFLKVKANLRVFIVAPRQWTTQNILTIKFEHSFVSYNTFQDYIDAFEKLTRLGLQAQQQREIILVILDGCLQEKLLNPYYVHLAQKFSELDRKHQVCRLCTFKMDTVCVVIKQHIRSVYSAGQWFFYNCVCVVTNQTYNLYIRD